MNARPKPGEEEEDLLKLQQEFLGAGGSGVASASVRRPDKRKTLPSSGLSGDVNMEEDQDCQMESGIQQLPKKSRFKQEGEKLPHSASNQSTPTNDGTMEDLERAMDYQDHSVAAVLTSIIERDTRNEICLVPHLGSQAFPIVKPVDSHGGNSVIAKPEGKRKKKSLFAQQVEAQGVHHFGVTAVRRSPSPASTCSARAVSTLDQPLHKVQGSRILDGAGLSASNKQAEIDQIHQENMDKLTSMTEQEILEEQKKLMEVLDPKLVEFIKKKRASTSTSHAIATEAMPKCETFSVIKERKKKEKIQFKEKGMELPIQPSKEWVHMDTVEKDKLEWLKDLPPPPSAEKAETGLPARFDFEGNVLAVDSDIPVNLGLHHHGNEPERAGYTLEEIFQLCRSSNQQQRTLAFHTLARIVAKAKSGALIKKVQSPIIPAILAGGVVMLVRWGLDDCIVSVSAAAVDALHALLWNPLDEAGLDMIWFWYQGNFVSALTPTATLEKESRPEELDEENQEEESDADVTRRDVIQAFILRMDLLVRFRFILENMRPQADTVIKILEILIRVAEHSQGMAYEIVKCPGLLDKVVKEFTPTAWTPSETCEAISQTYGLPLAAAIKLIRVLCQAGRNLATSLVSKYSIKLLLLRYLSVDAKELQLPYREATNLQSEAFALWRVCATYGLATETYFDMCSNIATYIGKLEMRWSLSASVTHSKDRLDSHLVCVLEKILYVAGLASAKSASSQSDEAMLININWSHVALLSSPLLVCTQRILKDIGTSYPAQKHDLTFPSACLNFLASFYELEGKQTGIDAVSSLDGLEKFCIESLCTFLSSYGFRVIMEHLCSFSNLLVTCTETTQLIPANLPTHGIFIISDLAEPGRDAAVNMPILRQHSPYGFLIALLRLALALSKRHKSLIPKVLAPLVKDKDILMYMRKICTALNSSHFATSLFTRAENLIQFMWLKCCVLVPCEDMICAHRLALNLVSRLGHGDEHLVHELITAVIFNQAFISEGQELDLTSEGLAQLSLSDVLHLRSATLEEINTNQGHMLQNVFNSLARIRGHYLMSLGGMEKAVSNSRNFHLGQSSETSSQMFKCSESLLPRDWMFLPLIHVYNKAMQSQPVSGPSLPPQAISMVTSVLQWSYAMEVWRPAEMNHISPTVRLSRILCAFIAGNDLFLEQPVHMYLAGLLRVYSSHKLLDKLNFEEKIPGMTSFYDLYQEVLDHYEAVSFGDAVFGLFVLLPSQQKHSSMLRKAVWGERRKMLRTLRIPLHEMLVPLRAFLEPEESDLELLCLQLSALISGGVQSAWSPVLYLVAVHHVNRFLFTASQTLEEKEIAACRDRMWTRVVQHTDKIQDVIYYKKMDTEQPKGLELYSELPQSRKATLDYYTTLLKVKSQMD